MLEAEVSEYEMLRLQNMKERENLVSLPTFFVLGAKLFVLLSS